MSFIEVTLGLVILGFLGYAFWHLARPQSKTLAHRTEEYRRVRDAHLRAVCALRETSVLGTSKTLVHVASNPHTRNYLNDLRILHELREAWLEGNAKAIREGWAPNRYAGMDDKYYQHLFKMTARGSHWSKFADYESRIGDRIAESPDAFFPPKE